MFGWLVVLLFGLCCVLICRFLESLLVSWLAGGSDNSVSRLVYCLVGGFADGLVP